HAVRDDHQRPSAHPVGEKPAERRQKRAGGEDEEREARERARPGQRLHPDREDDKHCPVAERGERLAGDQQPRVAIGEKPAHQPARNTVTSPLTVRPRRTTVGTASRSPGTGSLASGTSDERSPEVEPASTSTAEPCAMPISMSPETLEKRTSPAVTASSRMSPDTVSASTE